MIDLHVHSTFSDGSLTPEQLVQRACEAGLTALALTDHDSTGGLEAFAAACRQRDGALVPVPGVEISADVPQGSMHLLGYFFDVSHAGLQAGLARIREGREDRNAVILQKLKGLGLEMTWEEVAAYAGDEVVGRPHFARAMVARKYVASTTEAFDRYLARGKPAYVERFRLGPEDSVGMVKTAGGAAVLAHPFTLGLSGESLTAFLRKMRDNGLDGLEAYYSEHTPEQTQRYLNLARDLGLVVTGGSDFHGESNPAIRLGVGFGSLRVPDDLVAPLRARAAG